MSSQQSDNSPYEYRLVVLRSRGARALFRGKRQRHLFLELVHQAQRRTGIRIIAYALLDIEVHFIVQFIRDTNNLTRFVQRLKSQYTRRIHDSIGIHFISPIANVRPDKRKAAVAVRGNRLFKRRYHSEELAPSGVTAARIRLHQLPMERGLTTDPNRYVWSSALAYLRQVKVPWLSVDWALELDKLPDFPLPLPLSPDDAMQFVTWLTEAVMARIGLPMAELHSRKRSRKLTLVRGVVAYHAMRWGVTLRAVANALKPKASSTLARSTLTAAIDRYEPKYPDLFDLEIHTLLADVLTRRQPRALRAR